MKAYMKLRVAALAAALAVAGCGYDSSTGYTPPPADLRVSVVGLPATLVAGDIVPVQVRVQDAAGNDVPGAAVTLSSSDVSVAVVDAAGRVRAVAPGTATIRAQVGNAVGTARVEVTPGPAVFVLQRFDGANVPLYVETDTVLFSDGSIEIKDLYLDSGTLTLSGGAQPSYQTTIRFGEYVVTIDDAGQRRLTLDQTHDLRDQGMVSFDKHGDLTLTSQLPSLTESASAEAGGFKLLYRFNASDNEPKETFFARAAR